MRANNRGINTIRPVHIDLDVSIHAEGSCFIRMGNTHVLCTASLDETVPPFLRGKQKGWITAEYGMLPRSTSTRVKREASQGKQTGRTQEIQRLIGRSLRMSTDLEMIGERQILIDCDVIQADGGTRCASITGAYLALYSAFNNMIRRGILSKMPIMHQVAAVSCGIIRGTPYLDLDYLEDSSAEVDANFIMTADCQTIELQLTAEQAPCSDEHLQQMTTMAKSAVKELCAIQRKALKIC